MTEIQIRRFRDEDLPEVLEVLRLALGETDVLHRSPELWSWKHLANPFGPSLVLVATSGGKIVGVRAFMRWQLKSDDGSLITCARPVDTATHPGFLRRGIFRNLTLEALELAESQGIQLIFNTPNAKSKPGYLGMGWKEVGPVGIMVRPALRAFRRRQQVLGSSYLRDAPEIPSYTPEDRKPRGLRTPRTSEYLSWRFERHPTAVYDSMTVEGTAAFVRSNVRSGRGELVISDLVGPHPRTALRAVLRQSTADYVVTWFGDGPERSAARRSGLIPVPWFHALTLVTRQLSDLPDDPTSIDNWDLSIGDFELL